MTIIVQDPSWMWSDTAQRAAVTAYVKQQEWSTLQDIRDNVPLVVALTDAELQQVCQDAELIVAQQ